MKNPPKTIKYNQGDVVLQELYRVKDELSASYGHDVHRMFDEIRKHEEISRTAGWKFARLKPRKGSDSYVLHDTPNKKRKH